MYTCPVCLPVKIISSKISDTIDDWFNYFATTVQPRARVLVYSTAVQFSTHTYSAQWHSKKSRNIPYVITSITACWLAHVASQDRSRVCMLFKHSRDQGKKDNNYQLMARNQKFDLVFKLTVRERFMSRGENVSIPTQNKVSSLCRHVHSFTLLVIKVCNGSVSVMLWNQLKPLLYEHTHTNTLPYLSPSASISQKVDFCTMPHECHHHHLKHYNEWNTHTNTCMHAGCSTDKLWLPCHPLTCHKAKPTSAARFTFE